MGLIEKLGAKRIAILTATGLAVSSLGAGVKSEEVNNLVSKIDHLSGAAWNGLPHDKNTQEESTATTHEPVPQPEQEEQQKPDPPSKSEKPVPLVNTCPEGWRGITDLGERKKAYLQMRKKLRNYTFLGNFLEQKAMQPTDAFLSALVTYCEKRTSSTHYERVVGVKIPWTVEVKGKKGKVIGRKVTDTPFEKMTDAITWRVTRRPYLAKTHKLSAYFDDRLKIHSLPKDSPRADWKNVKHYKQLSGREMIRRGEAFTKDKSMKNYRRWKQREFAKGVYGRQSLSSSYNKLGHKRSERVAHVYPNGRVEFIIIPVK